MTVEEVLSRCRFPDGGSRVDLAVSGGADSVGLALLAGSAGLRPTLHHVDHGLRPTSGDDAALVADLAARHGWEFVRHDVDVPAGPNLEARARAARRAVLPAGVMTGHTMDDVAETVVLNLLRGAGPDGLAPMVRDPTKPLVRVRRAELRAMVVAQGERFTDDETNVDPRFRRNRVRHDVLPLLSAVAERDVVPVLARQAWLIADDQAWLASVVPADEDRLEDADCRALASWDVARLRRWLRERLRTADDLGDTHPPTSDEVERAIAVVRGEVTATELTGGRRLSRRLQRLRLEKTDPLRSAQ